MADLPVIAFIQERLAEADTTLETRKGTAFYDLFIKPQEFMLQPLVTAMETVLISESIRRIRNLSSPDTFDESLVDDVVSNVFVTRDPGDFARTTVRVLYATPLDREFPAFTAEFDSNNLSFFNEEDVVITAAQMQLQISGNFFFLDFLIRSQIQGSNFNLDTSQGVTFVNDTDAVNSTFLFPAEGGLTRETNTQILDRAKNSIGVRDLETIKGINAIVQEKFPSIREIQAIGMGDPEMMRDILFNAHVGGKTDIYLKTPQFQTKSTSVVGLDFDLTRELHNNVHEPLTALSFTDPDSDLFTPLIVSPSVSVKEDVIETAAQFFTAAVPPITGINLTGAEWIKLKVDNGLALNIKVSGATVTATQRFEIINAINAATGLLIASPFGTSLIRVQSQTIGFGSTLTLSTPDLPRTDGTLTLVPSASAAGYVAFTTPAIFSGTIATVYIENIDYQVDYLNGKIIKLPGSAILSGDTVAAHPGAPDAGAGIVTVGSDHFSTATIGAFAFVEPGDELNVTVATGIPTGTYVVSEKISNQVLKILGLTPSSPDSAIQYNIISEQVVVIDYRYHPLSIDIGPHVILSDGLSRGIRPGRDAFTIKDVAFINIISIEEIDPITFEGFGTFLVESGGFGDGGFGEGGFGTNNGGNFEFIVNSPTERFSAFEDALIAFDPSQFGKSFKVTYFSATEIADVHAVSRNDLERVTGADVLPKNLVPGFVDMQIGIRRDPTNITTPDDAGLETLIDNYIHSVLVNDGVNESDIIKILENQGLDSVSVPFVMTATVVNTDGSTTILESEDILAFPPVTLPKETDNFVTSRIVHFYPNNIVITEVL
jgi:hypothetical protein